jgi:hypothetical protein
MAKKTPIVDESSRDRKEAVALSSGVQPGKNNHCRILLQVGQLLGYSSYTVKLYPTLGSKANKDDAVVLGWVLEDC